jgi:hypothetical protein
MRSLGGKAIGFMCESGPDFIKERDVFTCQHCNYLIMVEPGSPAEDYGGRCKGCMGLICPGCVARARMNEFGGCDHIEKKLERAEKFRMIIRSFGR